MPGPAESMVTGRFQLASNLRIMNENLRPGFSPYLYCCTCGLKIFLGFASHGLLAVLLTLNIFYGRAQGPTPFSPQFLVNSISNGHHTDPEVAADSLGNFVVVWESFDVASEELLIHSRRFDLHGEPLDDEFQVNSFINSVYKSYA